MSGFEAFMTGFLGRTTEKISERKDKANDYFDQQMERARTVGVDALRQRREGVDQSISAARNLRDQAGMPEEIIRGLANEGPQALTEAQNIYNEAASRGVTVDETFWQGVYDFSTEMTSSSDVTIEEFLRQASGLYGSNLDAAAEEGGDPLGAFIASGLGLNAMSRARSELESTEVAEGFSAADLLAMEGRPLTTRPLGDTGYAGADAAFIGDSIRQASGGSGGYDPDEILRMSTDYADAVADRTTKLGEAWVDAGNLQPTPEDRTNMERQAREQVAEEYYDYLGGGEENLLFLQENLPAVYNDLPESIRNPDAVMEEEGIDTTVLPDVPSPDTPAPLPDVTIPEDAVPTAEDLPEANTPFHLPGTDEALAYQGVSGEGKLIFTFPNSNQRIELTPEEYRQALQSKELAIGPRQSSNVPNVAPFLGGLGN